MREDLRSVHDFGRPNRQSQSGGADAIRASLVDEFEMIVCPVVVGSGKRFFPDGVRLNLELVEERRFRKGVIVLPYAVRGSSS
jgi:dihydrofolate reductase